MSPIGAINTSEDFLKSLGFPTLEVHQTFPHFDFTRPGRRVLLIGPMGSGKTEFAAKVWRDAAIAMKKSDTVKALTSTGEVDRRNVFFIRSQIDGARFTEYPDDAMAFRSGYIRCGNNIARIRDSFDFEKVLEDRSAATRPYHCSAVRPTRHAAIAGPTTTRCSTSILR